MALRNQISVALRRVINVRPTVPIRYHSKAPPVEPNEDLAEDGKKVISPRMAEFKKKLGQKTPITDLGEQPHPAQEREPLKSFPNNVNPETGEKNGPKGPEPTRYGDWERKGRDHDQDEVLKKLTGET